jgi:hypothetical protein
MGTTVNKVSTEKRVWFGMLQRRGDHHAGEIFCGYLQTDGRIYMFIENGSELDYVGTMFREVIQVIPKYFEVIINISTRDYTSEINDMQAYLRKTRVFLGEIPEAVLTAVLQRHYDSSAIPLATVCSDGRTIGNLPHDNPFVIWVSVKLLIIKDGADREKRYKKDADLTTQASGECQKAVH